MERQAKDGTVYQLVGKDEWAPVTRTAKDGTVFKKVGADDWTPLKENIPQQKEISKTESAVRGFAQGASLGFADEISGAAESLFSDKTYEQARNESRANFDAARKANPGSYTAGEVGGSIATAAIPLGGTATLAKAVQTGARIGAINAYGQSEADNAKDAIRDVAVGSVMGAGGATIAKGVEKGIPLARKGLSTLSDKLTRKGTESSTNILSKETGSIPIEDPNVIKEVSKSAKERLKSFWNPKVDPSFKEYSEIAKKNGIDPKLLPESVKFGPNSSISRASRSIAEGRYGEETLKRFDKALDQVKDAYDKKIINYSKGAPVDEITAGKVLRDSYDEGVSKFFDEMDFSHNTIINQVPGLRLTDESLSSINSALNGIEKFAKGRLQRGITGTQRGQGQQLLNAVEAIRAGNGSYKQTVEALRDIGEAAFQSKNSLADIPVDVQKMRKLYNDISESLINTVKSELGDDIANSLIANNKAMSEFFGDQSLIARVMGDKAIAPERAFQSLILNGDSQRIQALKKIISPEKWEYLKGAVLENITKRDAEGSFTFKQLHNGMRNKKNALSSIFTPEELSDYVGLVRLGDRFGSPVLSSSGTGASFSFQDLAKSTSNLTVDALAIRNANKAVNKNLNSQAISKARDVSPKLKEIPSRVAGAISVMPEITKDNAKKGPEKWASDGFNKLMKHDSTFFSNQEIKSKLLSSKKGKELLIKASDLNPGSKAMEKVMEQIKAFKEEQ